MWVLLAALAYGADDVALDAAVQVQSVEIPGPLSISLGPTVASVVRRGDRRLGVVLAGAGTAEIAFADRGDAIALADRQVLWFDVPKAEMAPVAHLEQPYRDAVRHVVLWKRDDAWVDGLLAGGVAATAGPEVLEIARSRLALAEGNSGSIPADPATEWLYVDAELTRRLGYARPKPPASGVSAVGFTGTVAEDAWATFVLQEGWSRDVVALYRTEDGVVSRPIALPAWEEPAARIAGGKLRVEVLDRRIALAPRVVGSTIVVDATTTMKVRCNGPADALDVLGMGAADDHRTTAVTVDGEAVDPATAKGGRLRLAGPWKPGSEVEIALSDRYVVQATSLDARARQVGHALAGAGAAPFRMEAAVPAGLDVALAGLTTGTPAAPVSVGTGTTWISLGRWTSAMEPATGAFPQLRVHVDPAEAATLPTFAPFIRTVLAYYQQLLPALPSAELDVVQSPDGYGSFRWTSVSELITLQQMVTVGESSIRALQPHLEESVLAHEIAHQWWGGAVDTRWVEDRWLVESLAEAYACLFVSAAYGPKTCTIREDQWRATWEATAPARDASPRRASDTGAWRPIAYEYGPYVVLRMIRPAVGEEALFGGLDAWARTYLGTNDASVYSLQAALEATSGQDLGDFFDYWLDAGFVPAVSVAWDAAGVEVTSDVPFGTFDLPIRVTGADGERTVMVRVADGAGTASFSAPIRGIEVDPDHRVLRSATRVRKRKDGP